MEEQLELVPEQLPDYLDIGLLRLQPYRNTKSYKPKGTIIASKFLGIIAKRYLKRKAKNTEKTRAFTVHLAEVEQCGN